MATYDDTISEDESNLDLIAEWKSCDNFVQKNVVKQNLKEPLIHLIYHYLDKIMLRQIVSKFWKLITECIQSATEETISSDKEDSYFNNEILETDGNYNISGKVCKEQIIENRNTLMQTVRNVFKIKIIMTFPVFLGMEIIIYYRK